MIDAIEEQMAVDEASEAIAGIEYAHGVPLANADVDSADVANLVPGASVAPPKLQGLLGETKMDRVMALHATVAKIQNNAALGGPGAWRYGLHLDGKRAIPPAFARRDKDGIFLATRCVGASDQTGCTRIGADAPDPRYELPVGMPKRE